MTININVSILHWGRTGLGKPVRTKKPPLSSNLRLAGSGIHGQTGLARSNTGSDTCVQYALPDQSPEGGGSWSRMAHHPRQS